MNDIQNAIDKKDDTVMLIFKDVASAYKVFKDGLKIDELNVGAVQNGPKRRSVIQGVSLSEEEYTQLEEIKSNGVNVFLQPIPENDPTSLASIEKKFR